MSFVTLIVLFRVQDVARSLVLGLQNERLRHTSINVGNGKKYSVNDVAELVSLSNSNIN